MVGDGQGRTGKTQNDKRKHGTKSFVDQKRKKKLKEKKKGKEKN